MGQDEKDFIHDIATSLGTALFLAQALLENMKENPMTDVDDVRRVEETVFSLNKMKEQLQHRRELLAGRSPS